jgi:hypothetical protein
VLVLLQSVFESWIAALPSCELLIAKVETFGRGSSGFTMLSPKATQSFTASPFFGMLSELLPELLSFNHAHSVVPKLNKKPGRLFLFSSLGLG